MKKKKYPEIVDTFMSYLLPHGPITVKSMFGGYGIFFDGIIFASIIENELYFRTNEQLQVQFESRGGKQFIFESSGRRPVAMPYFTLPDVILKNPKELSKWIRQAYSISLKNKKKTSTPKSSKEAVLKTASKR